MGVRELDLPTTRTTVWKPPFADPRARARVCVCVCVGGGGRALAQG